MTARIDGTAKVTQEMKIPMRASTRLAMARPEVGRAGPRRADSWPAYG
jgi:hypothetical protein